MSNIPKADLTFQQHNLAVEVWDRRRISDEVAADFLRTDTNPDWTVEDRAVVAEYNDMPELAAELRTPKK